MAPSFSSLRFPHYRLLPKAYSASEPGKNHATPDKQIEGSETFSNSFFNSKYAVSRLNFRASAGERDRHLTVMSPISTKYVG